MNFRTLNDWSTTMLKKTNQDLISKGVDANKISKVRNILNKGIGERCRIIMQNTEENNKLIGNIEDYLKELSKFGISPAEIEKQVSTNSNAKKLD